MITTIKLFEKQHNYVCHVNFQYQFLVFCKHFASIVKVFFQKSDEMWWFPLMFILLAVGSLSKSHTRYTNIECEVLNPLYIVYRQCRLKVLGRGVVGMNLHMHFINNTRSLSNIKASINKKYFILYYQHFGS